MLIFLDPKSDFVLIVSKSYYYLVSKVKYKYSYPVCSVELPRQGLEPVINHQFVYPEIKYQLMVVVKYHAYG